MDNLREKVAVITGGASGMGLAFAHRFAAAGMHLAIADIETPALESAVGELHAAGAEVIGVRCDVSEAESMQNVATEVYDVYGAAHVICLNAGVSAPGTMAELKLIDWEWVLGVNLWGIIHGIDAFLDKIMIEDEGHFVITTSVMGHTCYPTSGPYTATKHAAVSIAETLYNELSAAGSQVGVTALCPGLVNTQIVDSIRNRPEHLRDRAAALPSDEDQRVREAILKEFATIALESSEVADLVHDAILDDTFWVFTDNRHDESISRRHAEIRERKNPSQAVSLLEEAFGADWNSYQHTADPR